MNRRAFTLPVLAAVALLIFMSQASQAALPDVFAAFQSETQSVKVWITGGDTTYDVHVIPSGCVDTAAAGTVYLVAPDDSALVPLECILADSDGTIAVSFCRGEICFETIPLVIVCNANCTIYGAGMVPGLNTWGILALVLVLVATSVWLIRRRRVPVS